MILPAKHYKKSTPGNLQHTLGIPLSSLAMLLWLTPAHSAEVCQGLTNKTFTGMVDQDTTCTVPGNIEVGPDLDVDNGVTLFLQSSGVIFMGPVHIYGPLSGSNGGQLRVNVFRMVPLNDTGITWGGDYPDGNNDTCTSNIAAPQDCHQGRDATHNDDSDGHAGFSFTKLDTNGNPLPASASDWSCVKDNVTGLEWEVKTEDGGLHDKNDTYTWYNTDSATNGGNSGTEDGGDTCYGYDASDPATYCNTQAYVARVNQAGWCGHHDWRMPTIKELRSLVDYSIHYPGPTIDTGYFLHQVNSHVLSASPVASDSGSAWTVYFDDGNVDRYSRSGKSWVRLVRGE